MRDLKTGDVVTIVTKRARGYVTLTGTVRYERHLYGDAWIMRRHDNGGEHTIDSRYDHITDVRRAEVY